MHRAIPLLCLVVLLATCAPAAPSPTPAPTAALAVATPAAGFGLVLLHGRLIDGTGTPAMADAAVVIRGERIVAAGPCNAVSIPADARLIDLQGATILPGLINAHAHSGYSAANLQAWAQAGVTTVRDLSNGASTLDAASDAYARRDGELGRPEYARLVASTPILKTPGGYGSFAVTSPEDARRAVDDLLDAGADLVKTSAEDNLQGRTWATLSMDMLQAITAAAHARGKRVSIHVSRPPHVALALEAGADDLAHMVVDPLPDDLIERLVAAGVYWTPTLELWQGVGWGAVPLENTRRFVARGGQVALGTDYAGYTIPFDLGLPVHEIEYMRQAGMTPMQIVVAATRNAAHVCGRDADLGTIEPGKLADVLVVDGDPLVDLHALEHVRLVIKGGAIIRDSAPAGQ